MRPSTLHEVSERVIAGGNPVKAFSEFLDHFYDCETIEEMSSCLAREPILLEDYRPNALYAASADYLSRRYRLETRPKWIYLPERYLRVPWFTSDAEDMREYLTFASPAEFRTRNIFTEALPLRRARTWQAEARVEASAGRLESETFR